MGTTLCAHFCRAQRTGRLDDRRHDVRPRRPGAGDHNDDDHSVSLFGQHNPDHHDDHDHSGDDHDELHDDFDHYDDEYHDDDRSENDGDRVAH